MPSSYRVLTTPAFEREFRKLSRKNPAVIKHLDRMVKILENDPYNRTHSHDIKQLKDVKSEEGQFRIRSGEWRLRYDITDEDIILHSFRHRKEAYR
ncbi:MAG: type II toxin-antitoxin system RelE/ParE family toxin [Deltaproteobacteria bacterium]|nr:type II toxin-antitoxin system RelE/ParE family toxin [Deltaproteobacteria bacterium]